MAIVTDAFTGTGALSGWAVAYGGTQYLTRSSDALAVTDGITAPNAYNSGGTFSGDQYAQVKVTTMPATNWGHGPAIKMVAGDNKGYILSFKAGRVLVEKSLGSGSFVIDTTSVTVTTNDVLKLTAEASGANLLIKAWKNGTQIGSTYTDTAPHTGTLIGVGCYYSDGTCRVDDFEGGDIAPPGSSAALSGSASTAGRGTAIPGISVGL